VYEPIESAWVKEGFALVEAPPEPQQVAITAKKILDDFRNVL
jgi:hypothetical protein